MGRIREIQAFMDDLRHTRTPLGLQQLMSDMARDMGFDIVTMYQHVDLSPVRASLSHMRCGNLVGVTTCPVSWAEHYRDHNLVRVDPRVLACRRTSSPFRTDEMGRIIKITSAQRDVAHRQSRANIGEGFTVPLHFPGEPSASCTFSVLCGRSLPLRNLAMANWIASSAYQAGRLMLMRARNRGARVEPPHLTERQLQCIVLVGRGLGEGAIAARLGIARETVKRHLKNARLAHGLTKSIQLVTQTLHDGQITLRDLMAEQEGAGLDARDA